MQVDIIICTRNRAEHLRKTLHALSSLDIPDDLGVNLIVVDNGSTDSTKEVAKECKPFGRSVTYMFEPIPGQARARNTGMLEGRGEVIVFTDDDVVPVRNWLTSLIEPICQRHSSAVLGKISLPSNLLRPWMGRVHRNWLCDTVGISKLAPGGLIGANMAFSRSVLASVPSFDIELGPGKLGFNDDYLFSLQLLESGHEIAFAENAEVIHYFEESRLTRKSFLNRAKGEGRSNAYLEYHWRHAIIDCSLKRIAAVTLKLFSYRLCNPRKISRFEGCELLELEMVKNISFLKQARLECLTPRKYRKLGTLKIERDYDALKVGITA